MKKILITGAAGFIGRHLVQRVLETTNWQIVALDGLSYAADTVKLVTDGHYDKSRIKLLWHDLRAPMTDSLLDQIGHCDYVVNVASNSHVDKSIANPAEFFLSNTALIANILEFARATKPEKFLQISTDEVFGPAYGDHQHSEWDVHCPSNPYAASKSAQEALCISYWRTYGLPLIITNTMNNFGEGQHSEKFIPLIIEKLTQGERVTVHGSYKENGFVPGSRYWLHASVHADAIIFLLRNQTPESYPDSVRPSRWNVVGEREVNNLEMVTLISEILGVEAKVDLVNFHANRPGHDLRYALNGDKLAKDGFIPNMDFLDSLKRTVLAKLG